jgi:hypothetical protein
LLSLTSDPAVLQNVSLKDCAMGAYASLAYFFEQNKIYLSLIFLLTAFGIALILF